ncbi:MAG: bifunctional oligoribonuclease/PAP phosphatase NrnA [Treponema sp.]
MNDIVTPAIPQKLIDFLHSYRTFLIAGHKEPDGDCIGSSLALSLFLRRMGKDTVLLSAGPFKRAEIQMYEPLFSAQVPPCMQKHPEGTAVIIVDCSGIERTGSLAEQLAGFPALCIDHHATNTMWNDASLVYTDAPSTTFLVQSIIEQISGTITRDEAELLFFGLCTDTGFFRHLDERSGAVFAAASRLVYAGVNPKHIFAAINGGKSLGSRILISRILQRMQPYYQGRLIISFETFEDTQEFGIESRDSDILYQLIQGIAEVKAICIVRQDTETHCSVGFRSLDTVDVSTIAASFGGGGHKQAAGLYIEGKIEELIPRFIKAFEPQLMTV